MKDYYKVLNVDRGAKAEEIKKAYREMVMKLHPDVSDLPDANERFNAVTTAYTILSDPKLRKKYDQGGLSYEYIANALSRTLKNTQTEKKIRSVPDDINKFDIDEYLLKHSGKNT